MNRLWSEPPLTDRELRIVRGMLDEYSYAQKRHAFWSRTLGTSRLLVTTVAAVTVIVLNAVTLALLLTR